MEPSGQRQPTMRHKWPGKVFNTVDVRKIFVLGNLNAHKCTSSFEVHKCCKAARKLCNPIN